MSGVSPEWTSTVGRPYSPNVGYASRLHADTDLLGGQRFRRPFVAVLRPGRRFLRAGVTCQPSLDLICNAIGFRRPPGRPPPSPHQISLVLAAVRGEQPGQCRALTQSCGRARCPAPKPCPRKQPNRPRSRRTSTPRPSGLPERRKPSPKPRSSRPSRPAQRPSVPPTPKKLRNAKGVSIEQLMDATNWQAHSVRGFLSGRVKKKLGLTLISEVGKDSVRRYRTDGQIKV